MFSFPSFRQFQPLVHPGMISSIPPFQLNGMSNPLLSPELMNRVMSPLPIPVDPMDGTDASEKKRILDVILKGQLNTTSMSEPCKRHIPSSIKAVPFSQLLETTSTSSSKLSTTRSIGKDRPIDLLVKRKRKIPKFGTLSYNSCDDDMDDDYTLNKIDFRDQFCVITKTERDGNLTLNQSYEVINDKNKVEILGNMPLKIMKLEAPGQ